MKEFKCLENCAECCGPVFFEKEFWEAHKYKANPKEVMEAEGKVVALRIVNGEPFCAFLSEQKKCNIYQDRPEVCRLYAFVPKMPCPFIKANGNRRSIAGEKRIRRTEKKRIGKLLAQLEKDVKKNEGN